MSKDAGVKPELELAKPAAVVKNVQRPTGEGESKKAKRRRALGAKKVAEPVSPIVPKPVVVESAPDVKPKQILKKTEKRNGLEAKTYQPRIVLPESFFRLKTDSDEFGGYVADSKMFTAAHGVYGLGEQAKDVSFVYHEKKIVLPAASWQRYENVDCCFAALPRSSDVEGLRSCALASTEEVEGAVRQKEACYIAIAGEKRPMFAPGRLVSSTASNQVDYDCHTTPGDSGFPCVLANGKIVGPHCGARSGQKTNYCVHVTPSKNC